MFNDYVFFIVILFLITNINNKTVMSNVFHTMLKKIIIFNIDRS